MNFVSVFSGGSFSITNSKGTTQWGDQNWRGWSLVGADTIDGVNTAAWEHSSGKLWFSQHNSDWAYTGSGGYAKAGSDAYFQAEANFAQDFNSDGTVGVLNQDQQSFL